MTEQEPVNHWPDCDMLEAAWGIIANVNGGDWSTQTTEWNQAAVKWRDAWHRSMRGPDDGDTPTALDRLTLAETEVPA